MAGKNNIPAMTDAEAKRICDKIRQTAYELHAYLGCGFLEKVYERGLAHRLEAAGFDVGTQVPLKVFDVDGYVLGDYTADMVVDGILVELKSASTISPEHIAQTINYLQAAKLDHGMLVNFGSKRFQCRKFVRRR